MLWVLKRTVSQGDGSFEHPKQMFKLMDKKIFANLHSNFCLSRLMLSDMADTKALLLTNCINDFVLWHSKYEQPN